MCYNLSMNIFTSVGIVFLSTLISSFLMLIPGIFANFFHYASGKYSRGKADRLSIFYILGAESMVVLSFFLIATIIWVFPLPLLASRIVKWIIAGVLLATGLSFLFLYFRKGHGSQLFISRSTAKYFLDKPRHIKTTSDAFVFGLVSGIPELPFTIPLYIASILAIFTLTTSPFSYATIIMVYSICTILPLFLIHHSFRADTNLADYLKLRSKNKTFFRFFLSFIYLLIAILIVLPEIISL